MLTCKSCMGRQYGNLHHLLQLEGRAMGAGGTYLPATRLVSRPRRVLLIGLSQPARAGRTPPPVRVRAIETLTPAQCIGRH
jgi:hypothetical protein